MEVQPHRFSALQKSFFGAALAVFAFSLADCGQIPLSTSPASGTFGSVYQSIQTSGCVECHAPGGSATLSNSTLDFTSQASAYSSLIAASATSGGSNCASLKDVVAGSPSTSYMLGALITAYRDNFSTATGTTCQPTNSHGLTVALSAEEQASLVAWIQNGALNN